MKAACLFVWYPCRRDQRLNSLMPSAFLLHYMMLFPRGLMLIGAEPTSLRRFTERNRIHFPDELCRINSFLRRRRRNDVIHIEVLFIIRTLKNSLASETLPHEDGRTVEINA